MIDPAMPADSSCAPDPSARRPVNSPFVAKDHARDNKKHLLFCCSGSVATIKAPLVLAALSTYSDLSIRVVLTSSAAKFLAGQSSEQPRWQTLLDLPNVDAVYFDEDEWIHPWTRNAPILHIELRRWADICVVAPLSANTLAKMVNGIADNLLTSVLRAWDTTGLIDVGDRVPAHEHRKRIVVAAAMNTAMWLHPVTGKQIAVLEEEWGVGHRMSYGKTPTVGWVEVLKPKSGELACGDVGIGAMVDWQYLVQIIKERLSLGS